MNQPPDRLISSHIHAALPGEYYIDPNGARHHVVAWRIDSDNVVIAWPIFAVAPERIHMSTRGAS